MLGNLRIKVFPKIIAIPGALVRSPFGLTHQDRIVGCLGQFLDKLSKDESRTKYLITWIGYLFASNGLTNQLPNKYKFKDSVSQSVFANQWLIFRNRKEFKLFVECKTSAERTSLIRHLDVFDPAI